MTIQELLSQLSTYNALTAEQQQLFRETYVSGNPVPNDLRELLQRYWFVVPDTTVDDQLQALLPAHIRLTPSETQEGTRVLSLGILTSPRYHEGLLTIVGDLQVVDLDPQVAFDFGEDAEALLERAKGNAFNRIKKEREQLLAGGFEFGGKHFQTRNDADRINIMGVGVAAQAALGAGQPFSVDFRATDNTILTLDAMTAIQFYATMVGTAQAIWGGYNTAYQAITTATTPEVVYAITLI